MAGEADSHSELEQYSQEVQDIVKQNQKEFDAWAEDPDKGTGKIPKEVLRYLIPPEIYAAAEDPSRVDIAVDENTEHFLRFFIVENKDEPVTNPEVFNNYLAKRKRLNTWGEKPAGVDTFHAGNSNQVGQGVISLNDLVLLKTNIEKISPEHMHIAGYIDRDEIRGRGITTAYYQRLNNLASELGYSYITGENDPNNIGFFLGKLGRVTLNSLSDPLQNRLRSDLSVGAYVPEMVTVQVLNGAKK